MWLPTGVQQRVGSLLGAQFRSRWVADDAGHAVAERPTVDGAKDDDGYAGRAASAPGKAPLVGLCEALHADPADHRAP